MTSILGNAAIAGEGDLGGGGVASSIDPRARVIGMSDAELDAILASPDDLLLVYADASGGDYIAGDSGDAAGSWTQAPGEVRSVLTGASWAKGDGSSTCYRNSSAVFKDFAGGSDYVTRTLLVWADGEIVSLRQLGGNSTSSGAVNTSNSIFFSNATTLTYGHQYGSKANTQTTFTLPFTLADGAVLLITVAQEDNADGTQDVRCWVNGEPCEVASTLNATDNLDGSSTMTDGAPGATTYTWLGILFSTGISCFGRALQVAETTTDDETEAAIALALLGSVGDPLLP